MVIETITAAAVVKTGKEILEILHFLRVGHETGADGYRAVSFLTNAVRQRLQKIQDEKDPAQKSERNAKTRYDFQTTVNAAKAIRNISKDTKNYLTALSTSLRILNDAKRYFSETHNSLENLLNTLELNDEKSFFSQLLDFKSNFESFKAQFNHFLVSIAPPDRELLYIADTLKGKVEKGAIQQFNEYLESIKTSLDEMEKTRRDIAGKFKQGFNLIPVSLSGASSSSSLSLEQLKQEIKNSMGKPEHIPGTMQKILSSNIGFADHCTDIAKISTASKQTDTNGQQSDPWNDNVNWLPLLTEEKQIEKGQRIFLHAMNGGCHSENEKLLLAQILLQQPIPKNVNVLDEIEVNRLSHELADILCGWQIQECIRIMKILSEMTQGSQLLEPDPDGLVEWLKTRRKYLSPTGLFFSFLVSPCSFRHSSIKSGQTKFKDLFPNDKTNKIFQQYQDSYWGGIREKSDTLIQLPESFKSKISTKDLSRSDDQSENSSVVSPIMHELVKKLMTDLQLLKVELENKRAFLKKMTTSFSTDKTKALEVQKNEEHEKGIERIKKSHQCINTTIPQTSILYPYLYGIETIKEVDKKHQVSTLDDLFYVIYRGVDPNRIFHWQDNLQHPSQYNQLLHYFLPDQKDDYRKKAWIYTIEDCQANLVTVFDYFLSSPANRPLAIENIPGSPDTTLLLQIILKNPNKISFLPSRSKVLNEMSPETRKKAETAFRQLQNYYVLAFTSIYPEYRNQLPFIQQWKCVIENLLQSTLEIKLKRLEIVKAFISGVITILLAENVNTIMKAVLRLQKDYGEKYLVYANDRWWDVLSTVMRKVFSCCFDWNRMDWIRLRVRLHIQGLSEIELLGEVEGLQPEVVEEERSIQCEAQDNPKEQLTILQEKINKLEQEKSEIVEKSIKDLAGQKTEFEAVRAKDKEESSKDLAGQKTEFEAVRAKDKEKSSKDLADQKNEFEAVRAKDKEESSAELLKAKKDKEKLTAELLKVKQESKTEILVLKSMLSNSEAIMEKFCDRLDRRLQQPASSSLASGADMPEKSSNVRFF